VAYYTHDKSKLNRITLTVKKNIAFIGQIPRAEQCLWLEQLHIQLPNEVIKPINELSTPQLQQCEVAIVANPDPQQLSLLPNLIWVQSLWAGVDALVTHFKQAKFKLVRLIDPRLAETMAEAVLTWVLYFHRDLHLYATQQKNKQWFQHPYRVPSECSVGILGLGELGQKSAMRLLNNGFKVSGWSRSKKSIPEVKCYSGEQGLYKLAQQCQIIICLLPLTDNTRHLINDRFMKQLKQGSIIINFARGGIINNADLLANLDSNHLAHAVLDVFEKEPLSMNSHLWQQPNITVLPHISAPTHCLSACEIVAKNIKSYRQTGEIPKFVDFARGY